MNERADIASRGASICGIVALLSVLTALAGAYLTLAPGALAFRVVLLSVLLAAVAFLLGLVGLWRCRGNRRPGRERALLGTVIGGVLVFAVIGKALGAINAPLMNDVSTDVASPPTFLAEGIAGKAARQGKRRLDYPAEFVELQTKHYPDIESIRLSEPITAVAPQVRAAIGTLGWELTFEAPDGTAFEATSTSSIFRFVDDVAIRLSGGAVGGTEATVVDIRSKSRVGAGDLGANATRIRAFREVLTK